MTRSLRVSGLAYGGDHNPEQWPEEVWAEEMRLMGEAGVTMSCPRARLARSATRPTGWTGAASAATNCCRCTRLNGTS